jgi:hypothetical protein
VKISGEGETPVYEITTDRYNLDKELTFHVFEDSSTSAIGSVSIFWNNDLKECLFEAIYPPENRSSIYKDYNGHGFEIDVFSFEEDIDATAAALEQIKEAYAKYGFGTDMIPLMHVEGKFVDTERIDGITVSSSYVDNVPKELIYQALFEMEHIANISESSYEGFGSDKYRDTLRNRYLCWSIENGLVDIYSRFSYEQRRKVNGFESGNKQYFAVINGEMTDESEEIYSDYNGNLPISSFYKLLKRQDWDVEGDWYHYKFHGIDGKEYEFGYDLCGLAADPVSSRSANEHNYSRTFNNFYYICDGVRYSSPAHKYEGKAETRVDIRWSPIVTTTVIREVTGWEVTSTCDKNK